MLILGRNIGETIVITPKREEYIYLTFLGFNQLNQIKLGFDAPQNTCIHRLEVFKNIEKQQYYSQKRSRFEHKRFCSSRSSATSINHEKF